MSSTDRFVSKGNEAKSVDRAVSGCGGRLEGGGGRSLSWRDATWYHAYTTHHYAETSTDHKGRTKSDYNVLTVPGPRMITWPHSAASLLLRKTPRAHSDFADQLHGNMFRSCRSVTIICVSDSDPICSTCARECCSTEWEQGIEADLRAARRVCSSGEAAERKAELAGRMAEREAQQESKTKYDNICHKVKR